MLKRTVNCGDVIEKEMGNSTIINGWVQRKRNLGGLLFMDIRDRTGIVQVVFDPNVIGEKLFKKLQSLKTESVVGVKGVVRKRVTENAENVSRKRRKRVRS